MPNIYKKDRSIEEIALDIVRKLKNAGYKKTYFVGGFVRDKLIGIRSDKPIDIDIATEARPDEIKKVFKKEKFIEIGEAFNIVIIIIKGIRFEIATFREDIFENDKSKWDGRYPKEVTYAGAEDDAKRRDFTVNGIFFDPIEKKHLDFVNGIEDIKNKIIRTIGEPLERFREDYLRMLRAVRFAVQKNFEIDQVLLDTIKVHSEKILSISKERIYSELSKVLISKNPSKGLLILMETNLLKWIYLYDPETGNFIHLNKKKFDFAASCLSNTPENLLIRWLVFFQLLHTEVKEILEIKNILINNKFDNKTTASIIWILLNKKKVDNWDKLSKYEKMEILVHLQFENLFLFYKIEQKTLEGSFKIDSSNSKINEIKIFYNQFKKDKIKWKQMKKFTIIDGNDLLTKGYKGIEIGSILKDVKRKYILNELENREDIFMYLREKKGEGKT